MVIKKEFRLVSNTPNILNLSQSVIKSYQEEENNPRHVFAILELKKKSIRHFSNSTIFKLVSDIRKRDVIEVVNFDRYPLPVSYNSSTKGLIINLKPFEVDEISNMSPNDLYASLVYAYSFSKLVTGKFKISESYIKVIVNYLLSFYVQVFGKDYGLVGIYASGIPKLKFLVACYIYAAFFGYSTNEKLFKRASAIAPYMYSNEYAALKTYDFSMISQFIKALSELKVMPGLSITKYTSKLYRFFGINILPAMEDISRFFSVVVTSTVPGSRVVPRYLYKYNEREFFKLIDITRRIF
jgi:hypothetical protein